MARRPSETPMMQQYRALKARAGEALLLFRMGDFYELFLDDAERAAPLLDLVLTTRDRDTPEPVPMCGVPVHAVEGYIRKLLQAGHAIAIAEQVENPKQAKGLLRREIVEVVTPGLVANPGRLEGANANYIAAVLDDDAPFCVVHAERFTDRSCAVGYHLRTPSSPLAVQGVGATQILSGS